MNQGYYNSNNIPPQFNQNQYAYMLNAQKARKKQKNELIATGLLLGIALISNLIIQTIAVQMLNKLGLYHLFDSSLAFQNFFTIIGVHICSMMIPFSLVSLMLKKNFVSPIIPTKKVGAKGFWAWVFFGIGVCTLANIVTALVIKGFEIFGYTLTQHEAPEIASIFDCVAMVIGTAIVPAIVEELCMRCFTLGALRKFGKGFSVFAVSIVFGLLHGNIIQFVFAFIVGLILAYIVIKTDNVVIAMVVHGMNNGLSVVQKILIYGCGKDTAASIVSIITFVSLVLSIISLFYLLTKKQFKNTNKQQKTGYELSFGKKLLYLLPGLAVPIMILVGLSITTITKTAV